MSSINISSLSQSTGSTSLLNYLNNDDDDNSIMSTLITNKRAEFESTLSKYGYSTSSSSDNSAYTKMESSNEALLDAISKLSSDSLYTAADGEEYDNSSLLTSVNNFVTAYNSSISNLTSTGGVLYSQYYSKLQDTFTDNAEALSKIGLSLGSTARSRLTRHVIRSFSRRYQERPWEWLRLYNQCEQHLNFHQRNYFHCFILRQLLLYEQRHLKQQSAQHLYFFGIRLKSDIRNRPASRRAIFMITPFLFE